MHAPRQWEALEYHHPKLEAAVILCFRAQAPENMQTLRPRGLDANKRYRVTFEDAGGSLTATGQVLAREGITVRLPEMNSSEIVWIEKA
jgi:hypothetical protein